MKVHSEEFTADEAAPYPSDPSDPSDPSRTYAPVARDLGVNRRTLRP